MNERARAQRLRVLGAYHIGKLRELKQKGFGPSNIAMSLKIGRASVYRAL
jgi:hypothetical protein